MYDRVLFPTDGSEEATVATEHALEFARRFDARLHVLYVVDVRSLRAADNSSNPALGSLEATGEREVAKVGERAERAGVDATTAVARGTPAGTIVEAAESDDVIVMGTHGRTGFDRYLVGSTAEKVVRAADVPVVTVPPTENTRGPESTPTAEGTT